MPFDNANIDETTRILIDARRFIERGWCRAAQGRAADGNIVQPRDERATQWCAYGALLAAGMNDSDDAPALGRLMRAINDGWRGPAPFNNAQTSREPVLAAFDRAIADCS